MNIARSALLRVAAAMLLPLAASYAWAQAHEKQEGAYVVRSSTVGSENLSEETARKHGIERSPHRAVLNVTVMKKENGAEVTVPADVTVTARSLTGRESTIPMKNTTVDGWVSYMGTYDFTHGEVLDFTISARPAGSSRTLTMTYRDRMWAQGKPVP